MVSNIFLLLISSPEIVMNYSNSALIFHWRKIPLNVNASVFSFFFVQNRQYDRSWLLRDTIRKGLQYIASLFVGEENRQD
jgi:hypothetical protein